MTRHEKPLKQEFYVDRSENGKRLDHFLKDSLKDYSRNRIKKVIDSGGVYVNRKRALIASFSLTPDDHIEFYDEIDTKSVTLKKSDIIYEDGHILAINKPANIPTQATYSSIKGTVLEIVKNYYINKGIEQYVRLIHRLDKGTTGVLLLSKTPEANKLLTAQFREKKVAKEYLALVSGAVKPESGTVETSINKVRGRRTKYENVKTGGKPAISEYGLKKKLKGHSLVTVRPKTGRTHQIRVHMAHLGHPILGDELYGGQTRLLVKTKGKLNDINVARAMLHAKSLTLNHPVTKKRITLKAKMPEDMKNIIDLLS
jgi:23S rRNA pseudouridine1911/1915/1917 synthase